MFEFIHALQVRGDNTADRATVGSAISMSTNILINGTGIQAGAASDTIQAFSLLWILKNVGTAVIQQDHVHFFRSVSFIFLSWPGYDGIVNRDLLSCSKSREQRPEQTQVR